RDDHDETHLRAVEDAVNARQALMVDYTSTRHGIPRERIVSVQRVIPGPWPRFIAQCHQARELRFFRVSRIRRAKLDPSTPYIAVADAAVEAFLDGSVDGYRDTGAPIAVAFIVREPELRRVADTTPIPMTTEPVPGGIRFSAKTAGIHALARFV